MIDSIFKAIRGIVKLRGGTDNTLIGNNSDRLKTEATQSGTWNINNISGTVSLPTGASTEGKQDTGNASLASIDSKVSTAAKQDTGNASLASIDGKLNSLGQKTMANSVPVVIASDQNVVATSANQTTEITSLQIIDDVPTSMNGAFVKGSPMMGQFDDASTTAATEDNLAPIRITAQRGAHSNLRKASGAESGIEGSPIFNYSSPVDIISSNTYSAIFVGNAATAGTNNPIILLRNPNASGKTVYIWKIICSGSFVANIQMDFGIFSNPTVTNNGTTITIRERNIGSSQATAVALATSVPTLSATGGQLSTFITGQNASAVSSEADYAIAIKPNNSLVITANPPSNNRQVNITVVWKEI